jgi:hypothetical protein
MRWPSSSRDNHAERSSRQATSATRGGLHAEWIDPDAATSEQPCRWETHESGFNIYERVNGSKGSIPNYGFSVRQSTTDPGRHANTSTLVVTVGK